MHVFLKPLKTNRLWPSPWELEPLWKPNNILLIGLGKHKSKAVADVIEGPLSAFCPGSILQNHPNATIVIDKLAASELRTL